MAEEAWLSIRSRQKGGRLNQHVVTPICVWLPQGNLYVYFICLVCLVIFIYEHLLKIMRDTIKGARRAKENSPVSFLNSAEPPNGHDGEFFFNLLVCSHSTTLTISLTIIARECKSSSKSGPPWPLGDYSPLLTHTNTSTVQHIC